MKSLEEVIKYKLKFLPAGIDPFYAIQTYTARKMPYSLPYEYDIYRLKNTIFPYDSLSFMEDITPLFIYISSCDKYYRENGHGKIVSISVCLSSDNTCRLLCMSRPDKRPDNLEEHRFFDVKRENTTSTYSWGSCNRYLQPFDIIFRGFFEHILTEEERLEAERQRREILEAYHSDSDDNDDEEERLEAERQRREIAEANHSNSDDNDDEEKEELSINDFKTFKLEQCVICLEKEPKVLFCNCGYICICEKCASHRYDNCLLCKETSTILRIIE